MSWRRQGLSYVRHPQYVGFILIMLGFLAQWSTLLTLLMFPILVVMYVRLARQEEQEVRGEFGEEYDQYAAARLVSPAWRGRRGTLVADVVSLQRTVTSEEVEMLGLSRRTAMVGARIVAGSVFPEPRLGLGAPGTYVLEP
jgi:hypothetical protein